MWHSFLYVTLYSSAAASSTCFSKATLTYSFKKNGILECLIPLICCLYSLGLNGFCFTLAEKISNHGLHQSQSFLFTQNEEEEELSGGCGFTINQVAAASPRLYFGLWALHLLLPQTVFPPFSNNKSAVYSLQICLFSCMCLHPRFVNSARAQVCVLRL